MRLDRVDIIGFKSFGERTELSFHEGVTAIVGPNGCGKSNISDAIGWALGEQSAKSLRGQKMEDLIFNGSERRAPVSFAEVNLRLSHINGSPDGSLREAVVTRRLYRSGESEYLLDGKQCRLRDVVELFMDTGMGNKGYSIMEQGKIGLILSSKPSDRRGVIEEAAGITKYKARRRSAELKLQAAQQNLLRVNDIVYEVERQMNSLKRQAGKARRYKRLRSAIAHLEKIAGVRRSREIEAELERVGRELKVLTDEELRRSTSLVTAETYLERLRLEQAEKDSGLEQAREKLHRLEIAIERLDHQITRDRQQLQEFASRQTQLEQDVRDLEGRLGPASRQLELRQGEATQAVESLSQLESHAADSREELARASVSLAEIERQIEENRAELVNRISKIATLNNFLQGVLANAEKVSAESSKLREEMRELEAERQRITKDRDALQQEQSERQSQATRLVSAREAVEGELSELRGERERVERDVVRRREEASSLSGRLASLEELVDARAHFVAGARALLTAGTELGVRLGGVIADAMEVEPEFERAAERFYGEALQRILVENEEDALAAHRWLEKESAGRCDFVIESLAGNTRPSAVGEALDVLREQGAGGVVGLLSQSIRWSNGKSELFARLLPDAVVVEDVEAALAAFHVRPDVPYVTRQGGAVLAPPGVLRAGPGGPSEGLLSSRREIRELRETLAENAQVLERQEGRQRELQEELTRHEAALADVSREQHSLEKILVGLEHGSRQLEAEWAQTERKMQVLASEQARADSERNALGVKRAEMEATLVSEEEAKTRVEGELEEARASLSDRRASVDLFQEKTAEEASKVAALRERVQAVRVDVERLQEGVNELRARVAAGQKEQSDLVARRTEVQGSLSAAEGELGESLSQRDVLRGSLAELEAGTGRLRERITVTEDALKGRRKELEVAREKRSDQEILLARQETEMNHLRQGFWDAHEISVADAAALLSPTDLARDEEDLESELSELKRKLDAVGPVNPMADEEFVELETRHEFLIKQRQDLLDSVASTEKAIQRIDTTSRQRFLEALEAINEHFQATFKRLFGGGRAGIRLIDEQDVLESGIDIIAQPPGKKLQNVLLLSGGEKAMTAIAIMFAIFRYKPSPFCLLDEVDAPLDDANVGRFLTMLAELRETTQFVVITHNVRTMEHADQMYGVTMEEPGISKLVSVRLKEGTPVAAASTG